ncbi:glycosyltransferase family 4 protein [Paenibacillus durus]|uniref:glycosyltransferase family 4 protein n=1 Tax=Paenibacillus durus TaxID=44251 RepID=UPI00130E50C0|nr:glycosyltransferase family 4 protein [Paenibacillus durus]
MWKLVSQSLLSSGSHLPITPETDKLLTDLFSGKHAWACLRMRWLVERRELEEVQRKLHDFADPQKVKILLYLAKICCQSNDFITALNYAKQAYRIDANNVQVHRRLASVHHRLGNITERLFFLKRVNERNGRLYDNELANARDEIRHWHKQWELDDDLCRIVHGSTIVHVWNKSLPTINGYTVRNAEIIKHQKEIGLHAVGVTKLGWPPADHCGSVHTCLNGVDLYRLYDANHTELNKMPMSQYFRLYALQFAKLLEDLKPGIIHAASNFQNALPPLVVARKFGIRSVYEVRGMWHYTQSSKTRGFEHSERYRLHEAYELTCCRLADRVVVINDGLKKHLIDLGIPSEKITVVYNGVNVNYFQPQPPCPELQQTFGLEGKLVIGFVGTLEKYEGLDYLLHALAILQGQRSDIKLIIVGGGPALPDLHRLSVTLGLQREVSFVGAVPHEQVRKFYSVMDILPFPRTRAKVCELVTPLKPFEAMAMGKTVMVSDIPALREIVSDGNTGLIFQPEDAASLAEAIASAERHPCLGRNAREWVIQERDWRNLLRGYVDVYNELRPPEISNQRNREGVSLEISGSDSSLPVVTVSYRPENHTCDAQENREDYIVDYLDDYVGHGQPIEAPAGWLDLRNQTYENYIVKTKRTYKSTRSAEYAARKSLNKGYYVKPFVRRLFTPDIISITHSKEIRSGGPRSGFLLETLEDIGGPPQEYYHFQMPDCPFHYSIFWGIFMAAPGHKQGEVVTDERLIGFIHLRRTGNVALYTLILGHGDHLVDGIMFHLHLDIVKWILDDDNPYGQGLDHLIYGRYYDGGEGRITWRKKTGFEPAYLMHPE